MGNNRRNNAISAMVADAAIYGDTDETSVLDEYAFDAGLPADDADASDDDAPMSDDIAPTTGDDDSTDDDAADDDDAPTTGATLSPNARRAAATGELRAMIDNVAAAADIAAAVTEYDIAPVVAAFTACPDPIGSFNAAIGAMTPDVTLPNAMQVLLAIGHARGRIAPTLPTTGGATRAIDPRDALRNRIAALRTYVRDVTASAATAATALAEAVADYGDGADDIGPADAVSMGKRYGAILTALGEARDNAGTRRPRSSGGTGGTYNPRVSAGDFVPGASFVHTYDDGTVSRLDISPDNVWTVDGRVYNGGARGRSATGAAAFAKPTNTNVSGNVFWTKVVD